MSEPHEDARTPLTRWQAPPNRIRHVVCIGDSITYAPHMPRIGVDRSWVDQLAAALDEATGARPGNGFQGLWRDEWKRTGAWTQPARTDAFDLAPFRRALYSSGRTTDELSWTKPAPMTVGAFAIYWFSMPNMGRWQYRVDEGPWTNASQTSGRADNMLHRMFVGERVHSQVQIRGHDGTKPCVAPIAGISLWASAAPGSTGTVVHNLGHDGQMLGAFCRPSAGDPLTLLDDLRPDLVTVMFSNDVLMRNVAAFGTALRVLLARVAPYADVLLMSPFEQRLPRLVTDAVTKTGSNIVTSESALFLATDSSQRISGTNIADGASIASVESRQTATMTVAATGSSVDGELAIEGRRDAAIQTEYRTITKAVAETDGCAFLDLHDAWASTFGAGWQAAWDAGLMHDGLHPTQLGHDEIATRVKATLGLSSAVTSRRAHR